MMLRKQTVWLLTMLSLVVVLSIYYINGGGKETANLGTGDQKQEDQGRLEDKDTDTTITSVTDEVFETIRLQLEEARSRDIESLEEIIASEETTAQEKSVAKDEMDRIRSIAEKERLLESLIVSSLGYEDALVRTDGEEVSITVKGQEPSKQKANEIIQMVKKELGTTFVTVSFQKKNDEK